MTDVVDHPEFPVYSESAKELYTLATQEVRRLATRYADYFSVRPPIWRRRDSADVTDLLRCS
jgi:hypothetical protein